MRLSDSELLSLLHLHETLIASCPKAPRITPQNITLYWRLSIWTGSETNCINGFLFSDKITFPSLSSQFLISIFIPNTNWKPGRIILSTAFWNVKPDAVISCFANISSANLVPILKPIRSSSWWTLSIFCVDVREKS